ncbi:hypothetical protein MTO96_045540 [Rhipicephalus appendiculatus]
MYPSDYCDYLFYTDVHITRGRISVKGNKRSWILFKQVAARRRNTEFGISFFWTVTPDSLDESASVLDTLRKGGIKHYGVLAVLAFQDEYLRFVSSMRRNLAVRNGDTAVDLRSF